MDMDYKYLKIEKDGKIATITINRPEALNALNREVLLELDSIVGEISLQEDINAVIITGAGNKAFVAGADIAAMRNMTPLEAKEFALLGQSVFAKIENLNKPVIAAVNGYALGGGCELAMACDLRIASENAKFGQPEVKLGITPGFGGTQRLLWLVGKARAKELIYTGGMIEAQKAKEWGLVNEVVPQEELLAKAKDMAQKIIANSPVAVRLSKEAINKGLELFMSLTCAYEAEIFADCFAAEDQKIGMDAFLNKKTPEFVGR
ncbi:MAG: enoyl-CoA hydratase [Clostridia bacterium]|nr:enoyl-CoA hydratase [Clostridia bacterium]